MYGGLCAKWREQRVGLNVSKENSTPCNNDFPFKFIGFSFQNSIPHEQSHLSMKGTKC